MLVEAKKYDTGTTSQKRRFTLRIAQVAPLYESVPPKYYGGTERVVSYLTEELVRQGHEVTLFASGDSRGTGVRRTRDKRGRVSETLLSGEGGVSPGDDVRSTEYTVRRAPGLSLARGVELGRQRPENA